MCTTRRKSLEFAEIRRRLQVELVKLRQSVPKSPSEPLVLRSGVRWLVLEFMENWVRGKMSRKWSDAVRAEGVDSADR